MKTTTYASSQIQLMIETVKQTGFDLRNTTTDQVIAHVAQHTWQHPSELDFEAMHHAIATLSLQSYLESLGMFEISSRASR